MSGKALRSFNFCFTAADPTQKEWWAGINLY
jgi:hypothetical protein